MKALIYLRVSTDKQAEKGLSIPTQKEKCLQYAHQNGYEVNEKTDIYADEGESAKTANRPNFLQMWQRCREDKTIKAVIIYDVSRFARNEYDFVVAMADLSKHGVRLRSATEPIDDTAVGKLMAGMLSNVAAFYSNQGGEKISLNM